MSEKKKREEDVTDRIAMMTVLAVALVTLATIAIEVLRGEKPKHRKHGHLKLVPKKGGKR